MFLKKVIIQKTIRQFDILKFSLQKKELLKQVGYLKGKRVVHVNAVAEGGGVAEILQSLIPYLRALGIESDWYAINPKISKDFFSITNKIHNAMQGAAIEISRNEWKKYERVNNLIAQELNKIDCDILVIHDPQPLLAGSRSHFGKNKIYFSHIDTSKSFKPVWKKLFPAIASYPRIVFSNSDFVSGNLPRHKVKIFTPAIDHLAPKQKIVPRKTARFYLEKRGGIPANAPLIAQISRFDIWKNPFGLIKAFRIVQKTHPKARLALVGFNAAKDNPAAAAVYQNVKTAAGGSSEIHLFYDAKGKNITEFTTMAQNAADVVVQNSIKEGFGLTVAEAMWKRQPIIGGPASGVRRQIEDGKNGFIAKTHEDLAEKINFLLLHPARKKLLGEAARKTVLKKFLFPRLVLDHLKLYRSCLPSKN